MRARIIAAPYHLGRRNVELGAGVPLLREELAYLATTEHEVVVAGEEPTWNEIHGSLLVIQRIAEAVRSAVSDGAFPLVLAGNCNASLGIVAGLDTPSDLGVVWFDAHADFNVPDTTRSGFFDGMALSMLTGESWAALRESVEGLHAVPPENVVHVGGRDFHADEETRLAASAIQRVRAGEPVAPALDELPSRVRRVYLHLDLDVLDPSVGRANWYAADGGLQVSDVEDAIEEIAERHTVAAAALTAYAPECDPERRIPAAAHAIAERIVGAGVRA